MALVRKLEDELLEEMRARLSEDESAEMAIPSYRHANPLLRWMAWRRVELLGRAVAEDSRRSRHGRDHATWAVDFGCGTGVLLETLSASFDHVIGVDKVLGPSKLLRERRNLKNVDLLDPESAGASIADGQLDAIIAAEVLEHIAPLAGTLSFFRRALKTGASLFVTLPTENRAYRFGRWLAGFGKHFHVHDAAAIHGEIETAGFRTLRIVRIPLPAPFDIYWLAQYRREAS